MLKVKVVEIPKKLVEFMFDLKEMGGEATPTKFLKKGWVTGSFYPNKVKAEQLGLIRSDGSKVILTEKGKRFIELAEELMKLLEES